MKSKIIVFTYPIDTIILENICKIYETGTTISFYQDDRNFVTFVKRNIICWKVSDEKEE